MRQRARAGSLAALATVAGLALPGTLGAQALLDGAVRLAPQAVSYHIGGDVDARITETAVPIVVVLPVARRLNLDVATAWASSRVTQAGTTERIDGLTDTQLRANYTFGADAVVLTAGVNLPTGQETVREDQFRAAGYIGNDFFAFPVSNLGTGFAATGGLAVARSLGAWNLGVGASMRKASAYDAFEVASTKVRYQPGDEYRARIGVDRALGAGRLALGVTYSAFGDDADAQTTYSTGDRIVTQAAWSVPTRVADLFVSGWLLSRFKGELAGGIEAPGEDVANLALTADIRAGRALLEPNVELRNWSRGGEQQATMATLGLRTRFAAGPLTVLPGAGYTLGSYQGAAGSPAIDGWKASIALRLGR